MLPSPSMSICSTQKLSSSVGEFAVEIFVADLPAVFVFVAFAGGDEPAFFCTASGLTAGPVVAAVCAFAKPAIIKMDTIETANRLIDIGPLLLRHPHRFYH